jgi:CxxC-x17-CxxC domain-containing protein
VTLQRYELGGLPTYHKEVPGLSFVDKTLRCRDCGDEFTFTAGEQEFYQQKGLVNQPGRCSSCRAKRRVDGNLNARPERAPREMHTVVCAECGIETQVPFLPKNDRPVYCSSCYDKIRVIRR